DIISNHPFKVKKKKRMLYKQYRTNKDKKRATIAANKLPKKLDIKGIETRKAYFYVYVVFQRYLNAHKLGSVVKTNIKNVVDFLNEISKIYNKNTLKKYKQALQWLLRISGKLGKDETLQNISPACDVNYTP